MNGQTNNTVLLYLEFVCVLNGRITRFVYGYNNNITVSLTINLNRDEGTYENYRLSYPVTSLHRLR